MYEVLAYVYENYWRGDACPAWPQLGRKLSAMGFEADDIQQALAWLEGLNRMAKGMDFMPSGFSPALPSLRVYNAAEQEQLGAAGLGFLSFLEGSGVLAAPQREIVVDRAMAAPRPLSLEDLKLMVLMVFWQLGEEPDALILDELLGERGDRLAH